MLFHVFDRARPKILVVSHERSGTHFLMNALARSYNYYVTPWVNFDLELGLNFHNPPTIAEFFAQFRNQNLANIVKAHHAFSFFEGALEAILQDFHLFYIFRDPRDVMVSYWKFLNHLPWHEGPKTDTCREFIRAEPAGAMMRYQQGQEKSLLHRWVRHVDGWTQGVPDHLASRVTFVRFDELSRNYEHVLRSFAPLFDEGPFTLERPGLHENSILPNSGGVGTYHDSFDADDLELFDDIAGPTMRRLGLVPPADVPPAPAGTPFAAVSSG